ncbi:MAG: GGDEF domain-containing protein [Rubrivivax sp.]
MTPPYDESPARAAECLRLALPLMARQTARPHPWSYAVWYEHVAGRNQALSRELDRRLAGAGRLDEADIDELYRRHLADDRLGAVEQVAAGLGGMLQRVGESARAVGGHSARFGAVLQAWERALAEGRTGPEQVAAVREGTDAMRAATDALQGQLDAARAEVTRLRGELERAREEALCDGLTGLANRRAFDQRMQEAGGGCLLLADIDHFKRVNDAYGHLFGDQVLRSVAAGLRRSVPPPHFAARIGGEEFAVLAPDCELAQAQALAERIRSTVAQGRIRRGAESLGQVTVSLGIARRVDGESPQAWYRRADAALYAAKSAGRNRAVLAA